MKIRFLYDGVFEYDRRPHFRLKGEMAEVEETDAKRLMDGLCAEAADIEKAETKKPRRKNTAEDGEE